MENNHTTVYSLLEWLHNETVPDLADNDICCNCSNFSMPN